MFKSQVNSTNVMLILTFIFIDMYFKCWEVFLMMQTIAWITTLIFILLIAIVFGWVVIRSKEKREYTAIMTKRSEERRVGKECRYKRERNADKIKTRKTE